MSSIFEAIKKQRAKQRATLPEKDILDTARDIVYGFIKLPEVQARPAKDEFTLLTTNDECESKLLLHSSVFLNANGFDSFEPS